MLESHVSFIMEFLIWQPFSFEFCCIVCIFLGICAIFYVKMCLVFRKSACPLGQVKTYMFLLESPFSKIHLPGQAGKYLFQCLYHLLTLYMRSVQALSVLLVDCLYDLFILVEAHLVFAPEIPRWDDETVVLWEESAHLFLRESLADVVAIVAKRGDFIPKGVKNMQII